MFTVQRLFYKRTYKIKIYTSYFFLKKTISKIVVPHTANTNKIAENLKIYNSGVTHLAISMFQKRNKHNLISCLSFFDILIYAGDRFSIQTTLKYSNIFTNKLKVYRYHPFQGRCSARAIRESDNIKLFCFLENNFFPLECT